MRRHWIGLGLAVALITACAGNPAPGDEGYAFNLNGEYAAEFITHDDGMAITGTVTLGTARGGDVSGTMALQDPFTVDGDVAGIIEGSLFTMTVPYTIVENGCAGVATGTGEIAEGGGTVSGEIEIADECEGAPMGADFTLTRQ
jgi:hypothetical protein